MRRIYKQLHEVMPKHVLNRTIEVAKRKRRIFAADCDTPKTLFWTPEQSMFWDGKSFRGVWGQNRSEAAAICMVNGVEFRDVSESPDR
jgi:hypothetical protein